MSDMGGPSLAMPDVSAERIAALDALDGANAPPDAPPTGAPPSTAPAEGSQPRNDDGTFASPAPAAAPEGAGEAPPPWEGKTAEELWQLNEKLRDEAIKAKDRWRPLESTFDGLDPTDVAFFQSMIGAIREAHFNGNTEPFNRMAPFLREMLDKLSPAQQAAVQQAAEQAQAPELDPYDPESVKAWAAAQAKEREGIEARMAKMVEDRFEAAQRAQAEERQRADSLEQVRQITTELAESTGLKWLAPPQPGSPPTYQHRALLFAAQHDYPDDPDLRSRLTKAADAARAEIEESAQQLLQAKAADAAPSPVPADAASPTGRKEPSTFEEAEASMRQRLDIAFSGSPGT